MGYAGLKGDPIGRNNNCAVNVENGRKYNIERMLDLFNY